MKTLIFFLLASPALGAVPDPSTYEKACDALARKHFRTPDDKLAAALAFQWRHDVDEFPENATSLGLDVNQDKWADMSMAAIERRKRETACPVKLAASIARSKLRTDEARVNLDLYKYEAETDRAGVRFPSELIQITSMGGVHQEVPNVLDQAKRASVRDVENLIARLERVPELLRQNETLLREGVARGVVAPKVTLSSAVSQFDSSLTEDMEKNSLYRPFADLPPSMAASDRERLRLRAKDAIRAKAIPAFARLRDYLKNEYIPRARASIALADLPDGKAWYAFAVRRQTTSSLSAEEIHRIGLAETDRLLGEMKKTMAEAGWKKGLPEFFKFLREDKQFKFKSRDELIAKYRELGKRLDPEIPKLFGRLPRTPWGVKPAPPYNERSMAAAYYMEGSLEASRAGYFMANAYALETRYSWFMEDTLYHEAVPGHHLQISIAQEQTNAPEFRKHIFFGAFIEGWALYAETLGYELGGYQDPYSKMGQLAGEMWRACRLVVDTGIHALGWSREKAIQFMVERAPNSERDDAVEVDRYISLPGQALTYKLGQLKFSELRRRASEKLGAKFDVRAFHDVVLGAGALPLETLDARVNDWIAAGGA